MSDSLGGGKMQTNVIQTTSCELYHLPRAELLVVVQICSLKGYIAFI